VRTILVCVSVMLLLAAVVTAADSTGVLVELKVGDVVSMVDDTLIEVPVFISNPVDSIGGIEMYFVLEENPYFRFASDDKTSDGLSMAVDSTATLLAGWGYLGANSMQNTPYDLKVVSIADWVGNETGRQIKPQTGGKLVKLRLRQKLDYLPSLAPQPVKLAIVSDLTSFSDPFGHTIGVITKVGKECAEYDGDSCISWKPVLMGTLDTNLVKFVDGSVTLKLPGITIDSMKKGK